MLTEEKKRKKKIWHSHLNRESKGGKCFWRFDHEEHRCDGTWVPDMTLGSCSSLHKKTNQNPGNNQGKRAEWTLPKELMCLKTGSIDSQLTVTFKGGCNQSVVKLNTAQTDFFKQRKSLKRLVLEEWAFLHF